MITKINEQERKRFRIGMVISSIILFGVICISLTIGQFHMSIFDALKALCNTMFGTEFYIPNSAEVVVANIRLPRTVAAFIIGSCLAVSGNVYQSTFNNPLVSPDVLGVSAGACVGAAIAILFGVNSYFISLFAFFVGIITVAITLMLPNFFRNRSTLTLVLSGIIVGSFMDSLLGIIKFTADNNDKLSEITFWIMGALTGVNFNKIVPVIPIYIISMSSLMFMSWKINVLSLGEEEARTLGMNYKCYRVWVIVFSTLLTAVSVSICGNVGWIGLVIPHIVRALFGFDNRFSIPMSIIWGGIFMIIVDILSRNISTSEIPLSIITGIVGTVIYTFVLVKKGGEICE